MYVCVCVNAKLLLSFDLGRFGFRLCVSLFSWFLFSPTFSSFLVLFCSQFLILSIQTVSHTNFSRISSNYYVFFCWVLWEMKICVDIENYERLLRLWKCHRWKFAPEKHTPTMNNNMRKKLLRLREREREKHNAKPNQTKMSTTYIQFRASACIPRIDSHKIYNIFKAPRIYFIGSLWNSLGLIVWCECLTVCIQDVNESKSTGCPHSRQHFSTKEPKTKLFDLSGARREKRRWFNSFAWFFFLF